MVTIATPRFTHHDGQRALSRHVHDFVVVSPADKDPLLRARAITQWSVRLLNLSHRRDTLIVWKAENGILNLKRYQYKKNSAITIRTLP